MAEIPKEPREGYLAVGIVVRPFGLHGDMKVMPLSDFPERFAPGGDLWLLGRRRSIERSRSAKGEQFLKLSGIDDPEAVEQFRGELLEVPEGEAHALEEGEFYHFQLIGLSVHAQDGEVLGAVQDVLEPGGNAVLVVQGARGEILVPFIDDVVRSVDVAGGRITIEVIEGLLPEERRARPPHRPRRARHASGT